MSYYKIILYDPLNRYSTLLTSIVLFSLIFIPFFFPFLPAQVELKEQDKSLLKQFNELRASIFQLRCDSDLHSSCSDVSSLAGSTFSLNESVKTPEVRRLVVDHELYLKPSLSLPNSPRVARFRWTSQDFL